MEVTDEVWDFFQEHLGYTDEEIEMFRKDPKNEEVISKGADLLKKTIVAEVVESHGCNSSHKVGDRFYFDGSGNLLTKLCPSRICAFALASMPANIAVMQELLYAGVDPNEIRFKRVGCPDVGVQCGGWGHVVFELRMEDRENTPKV